MFFDSLVNDEAGDIQFTWPNNLVDNMLDMIVRLGASMEVEAIMANLMRQLVLVMVIGICKLLTTIRNIDSHCVHIPLQACRKKTTEKTLDEKTPPS